MSKKFTWEEIEKHYDGEWVELVDYDWPDDEPNPRSGIVRAHNKSHDELYEQIFEVGVC